jgi:hypothetical protein
MANKNARSGVCEHGLTDDIQILEVTTIERWLTGKTTKLIGYFCEAHQRHGVFKIETMAPPRTKAI